MKVLVLWSRTSGYMEACWSELVDVDPNVSITVCAMAPGRDERRRDLSDRLRIEEHPRATLEDAEFVDRLVAAEAPDVVVVSGWWNAAYRRVARSGVPYVVGVDNAFETPLKKVLLRVRHGRFLRGAARVAVPGELGLQLLSSLGVPGPRIVQRLYGVGATDTSTRQPQRRFLFVGQLIERKGVDTLLAAYARYRETAADPFELHMCGDGPLQPQVRASDAVYHGQLDYASVYALRMTCPIAVLPSRKDHWALAVVEAVVAGQAVICSDRCGSAVEVVRDGWNGAIVPTGDVDALCAAMHRMADLHDSGVPLGERGIGLAAPYTAPAWAEHWSRELRAIVGDGHAGQREHGTVPAGHGEAR